jgi:folylpolyglutamate synthase/dihydropteroate synthase
MTRHLAPLLTVIADPREALERAISAAAPEDVVFATGSLYLVGELRKWWNSRGGA